MTDRPNEERPNEERPWEPENPVEELLKGFEKTRWRPAKAPWGETARRRLETEERREELMIAWRRRRIRPMPGPGEGASEDDSAERSGGGS